jgi:hypothetical protein
MITIDIQENKHQIRQRNADKSSEQFLQGVLGRVADDERELINTMQEMEIVMGEREDLFKMVSKFLITTMKLAQTNKKMLDLTYTQITLGVGVTKMTEKKKITDYFENMDDDVRKVNYLMKSLKLGEIWEEGLRKSVFQYDKKAYDKARDETSKFFVSDLQTFDIELPSENTVIGVDEGVTADDLDVNDNVDADREEEEEGNDISHLRSGFMDGNYYSDDNEGESDYED